VLLKKKKSVPCGRCDADETALQQNDDSISGSILVVLFGNNKYETRSWHKPFDGDAIATGHFRAVQSFFLAPFHGHLVSSTLCTTLISAM